MKLDALLIATALTGALLFHPAQAAGPVLEAKTQAFVDTVAAGGGKPIYTLSYDGARAVLDGAQKEPVPSAATEIQDTVFPVGPTRAVKVRIVRPAGAAGVLPVVVYFHGGGWVMGGPNTHDHLIRELAAQAQAAVVFVDYGRAPEIKFPANNEQAYAAIQYIVEHGAQLDLDASRIALAGDSAGGNMAAAVTLLSNERKGPQFVHQVLFYPAVDDISNDSSYQTFANGPWLTKKSVSYFYAANFPVESRRDPHAWPLKASVEQLRGLPPATVIVAGNDLLRDEGEAYAQKLAQAGVNVTSTRYYGTIHDFVMLNGLADTPAAKAAIAQAATALRAAFAR